MSEQDHFKRYVDRMTEIALEEKILEIERITDIYHNYDNGLTRWEFGISVIYQRKDEITNE